MHVRRIAPDDWPALRDLRLAALMQDPAAFGQRHDQAARQPDNEWQDTARAASAGDGRAWFLAEDDAGRAVGLVLGRRRPPDDCLVFSMWVDPSVRHGGVGRALVQAVAEWAGSWGARRIVLWVIRGNDGALRFYERIGFRIVTDGPDAESGAAYGALAMERPAEGGHPEPVED
ncbi:MAG TPA: GNAT family N-acetyltransferase [Candidatus Caenarcaniphilales bacterium]|nr:GNAT family N-acetyltransferase [Candidatus Caenarcaniphilales bacterium]